MNKDRVVYTVTVSRPSGAGLPTTDVYKDVRSHQIVAGDPSLLVLNDRHGCRMAIIPLNRDLKVDFTPIEVPDLVIADQFNMAENGVRH